MMNNNYLDLPKNISKKIQKNSIKTNELSLIQDRILAIRAIEYAKKNGIKPTQKNFIKIKERIINERKTNDNSMG